MSFNHSFTEVASQYDIRNAFGMEKMDASCMMLMPVNWTM
jgi:hypothetical protein